MWWQLISSAISSYQKQQQQQQATVRANQAAQARAEKVKREKQLLDAQLKNEEAQEAFLDANPEFKQAEQMPEGAAREVAKIRAGMGGLNKTLGRDESGQKIPGPMEQVYPYGKPQEELGLDVLGQTQEGPPDPNYDPTSITQMIAQAQTNPALRGALKKATGIDYGKTTFQKGLKGPGGVPVTKQLDVSGDPTGTEYQEYTPKKFIRSAGKAGAKVGQFFDPATGTPVGKPRVTEEPELKTTTRELPDGYVVEYETNPRVPGSVFNERVKSQPKLVAVEQVNEKGQKTKVFVNPRTQEKIKVAPADKITRTFMQDGVTFEEDINKITRELIGVPRIKTELKGVDPTKAGRITLGKVGIGQLATIVIPNIIKPDGTIDRTVLVTATGKGVPGSKGRTVKQAFGRAVDAVIRAATGAALNEQELANYENQYFPSALDSDEAVRNKLAALQEFLGGFVAAMDPQGRIIKQNLTAEALGSLSPRLRTKTQEKANKPSLDLGKKAAAEKELDRLLRGQ